MARKLFFKMPMGAKEERMAHPVPTKVHYIFKAEPRDGHAVSILARPTASHLVVLDGILAYTKGLKLFA